MNTCPTCGHDFVPKRNTTGRYCSRKCYWEGDHRGTVEERFLAKISKPNGEDGCWIWTGSKTERGYGAFSISHSERVVASRYSWQHFRGPIPEGLFVCHDCPGGDNPSCVNPAHLFLGTNAENMKDAVKKGTCYAVHKHAKRKLTAQDVTEIRNRSEDAPTLATAYGVSRSTITAIIRRERWAHVV